MQKLLFALLALTAPAWAGPKVLLCVTDGGSYSNALRTNLMNTGAFDSVTTTDCQNSTPSLATLKNYNAVLSFTNSGSYADRITLGNNLADYIDQGGGVVLMMYSLYGSSSYYPQGRFAPTYQCITPALSAINSTSKGAPNDANHPLVKGVNSFSGNACNGCAVAGGATSVWDHSNGNPGIVRCMPNGKPRVDLNFWPGNGGGDWQTAVKNALLFVGGGTTQLEAMPNSIKFPDTGAGAQSQPVTVTLTNKAMGQIKLNSITVEGSHPGDFLVQKAPALPVSIGVGVSLTVDVVFRPMAPGARSATVKVAVDMQGTTDIAVSGNGIPAKIGVTPNPIAIGIRPGQAAQVSVTVSNGGGGQLSVQDVKLGGMVNEFTLSGLPGFPVKLGPGATFNFGVRFQSNVKGTRNATVTVQSDDVNTPNYIVPLVGTVGEPEIKLDVGSVIFGAVRVGTSSAPQEVLVQNLGLADLKVGMITVDGANAGDFTIDGMGKLPGTVGASSSQKFGVACKPSALGMRTGRVVVSSDDPNSPTRFVSLQCTGTSSALAIAPATLDFGTQKIYAASSPKTVTVSNTGMDLANLTMVTITGAQSAWFAVSSAPPLPAKVPAMVGSASINVVALPTGLGPGSAILEVLTDDPKAPKFTVPLKTEGVGASITITPPAVDFGAVGLTATPKPITVTIGNKGTDTLTLSNFALTDMNMVFGTKNDPMTPAMIAPGANVSFDVTFKPGMAMAYIASIDLATDDPMAKMVKIPVAGLGATAGIGVSPMSLDFGAVPIGTSAMPQTITVTNTGDAPLAIGGVTLGGAAPQAFSLDSMAGFALDGMKSQKIAVTFNPPAGGVLQAKVVITPTGLPPVEVTVKGTGVVPMLGVSPAALDFGMVNVGTVSDPQPVRLKNGGMYPLRIATITTNDSAFVVDASKANLMLGAGGETAFTITFKPSAVGTKNGTAAVTVAGSGAPIQNINLTGAGVTPPPSRRPSNPGGCSIAARPSGPWVLALLLVGLGLRRRRRP